MVKKIKMAQTKKVSLKWMQVSLNKPKTSTKASSQIHKIKYKKEEGKKP